MKKALITGITWQDGYYLTGLLMKKGYMVYVIMRRISTFNTSRITHLFKNIHEKDLMLMFEYGDLYDFSTVDRIIRKIMLDEVYNLGAQSRVR